MNLGRVLVKNCNCVMSADMVECLIKDWCIYSTACEVLLCTLSRLMSSLPFKFFSLFQTTVAGASNNQSMSHKSPVKKPLPAHIFLVKNASVIARSGGAPGKKDLGVPIGRAPAFVPRAMKSAIKVSFVRTSRSKCSKKRNCCQLETLGSHPCSCLLVGKKCFNILVPTVTDLSGTGQRRFVTFYPPCPKCYERCSHDRTICCRKWPC